MDRSIIRLADHHEEEIPHLELLVALARDRLADLLAEHGAMRVKVERVLAVAFEELGALRERQELLESRLNLLRWRLKGLVAGDPAIEKEFEEKWEKSEEDVSRRYREARLGLEEKKKEEPEGDRAERLRKVWKKLVRLYHPDKHHNDPDKRETYESLMAVINRAKEDGDLETLEKIAKDPEAFARGQGWDLGGFNEDSRSRRDGPDRARELRELLASLNEEILKVEVEINELRASDDYALYELWQRSRSRFSESIEAMRVVLEDEVERMEGEIDDAERRIRTFAHGERKCA